MSIIIFIVILLVLVVSHEFGHFIVAKKSGIRVDEFSFGFPPKLYGKKIGETTYNLNALPFGGYVKIFGENGDDENINEEDKKRSFTSKPRYIQAGVLPACRADIPSSWRLPGSRQATGTAVPRRGRFPRGSRPRAKPGAVTDFVGLDEEACG